MRTASQTLLRALPFPGGLCSVPSVGEPVWRGSDGGGGWAHSHSETGHPPMATRATAPPRWCSGALPPRGQPCQADGPRGPKVTSFLGPTPPSSSASEELISSSALDQPSLSSGASKG